MSTDQLLEEARGTLPRNVKGKGQRRVIESWMPAVNELRAKHFSYLEIYEWLKSRGIDVHERPMTFISAVSRRRRRWLNKQ